LWKIVPSCRTEGVGALHRLGRGGLLPQVVRYGISGSAAAATLLVVLTLLVEVVGVRETLASAIGFSCAVVVNYALQHSFVFVRARGHALYLPRYLAVTMATLALNTALFWSLSSGLGMFYLASQVITIGVIVPINFAINRSFTFAT
jgi:putative flippase GtrA